MGTTYKVEARCNTNKGINIEFKGIEDVDLALKCANTLAEAFPVINVTDEQTGEAIYYHYIAVDLFEPYSDVGAVIYKAERDVRSQ